MRQCKGCKKKINKMYWIVGGGYCLKCDPKKTAQKLKDQRAKEVASA